MDTHKKEKLLNLLTEYRQEVKAELDAIDEAIQLFGKNKTPSLIEKQAYQTPEDIEHTPENNNPWAEMSTHQAVVKLLGMNPNKAYRASDIKNKLKEYKFPRAGRKAFPSNVATTVRRLVEKGEAIQTTVIIKGREVAAFQYKNA